MARSIPALVNNRLLVWAREQVGYSVEEVANKLRRKSEELRAWEAGEKKPTLRQAEKIAKLYQRSFSIFTLKEPPKTVPLATEYRRLPKVTPGKESPSLRFALRDLLYRRHVALSIWNRIGEEPEEFALEAKLSENTETAARRIREILRLSVEGQMKWQSDAVAWKAWRNAIELQGVLVFVFSGVEHKEVRGVTLFNSTLPVIGINSKEIPASRPFTLLHEFIHLLLANGAEEKPASEEKRSEKEWSRVEEFAERVASGILMPVTALDQESLIQSRTPSSIWTIEEIQKIATRYRVTPSAFATRLLVIGRMSPATYKKWKDSWEQHLKNLPIKKKGGFFTPAEKALNRNGETFTSLVIDALNMERITPIDASRYLNIHYPHIDELRLHFAFGQPLPKPKRKGKQE
jgi:Zn-dependent peptidase ImmA (M78 family)/DNA-binding XRE family transcriptional regulator